MTENEQPATSAEETGSAVQRITAAAAATEAVTELPLAEHAERYQQLHATLQAELGAIAHL